MSLWGTSSRGLLASRTIAVLRQLEGFSLTTAEILYRLPDHPRLLQSYIWQDCYLAPKFPKLVDFLIGPPISEGLFGLNSRAPGIPAQTVDVGWLGASPRAFHAPITSCEEFDRHEGAAQPRCSTQALRRSR
jgi:hypothetical protein